MKISANNETNVNVTCDTDFGADGEPGDIFQYNVKVSQNAGDADIAELIRHTDGNAEIIKLCEKESA